jgi:type IV secretory pathway VirB4 component
MNVPLMCGAALLLLAVVLLYPELKSRRRELAAHAKGKARQAGLADYLPYRRLIRPDVIKNASGSYLAAWRVAGHDVGGIGDTEILNTAYQLAATIGALPTGTSAQFYARRVPFREYDRALGADHPVLELVDDLRADFFLRLEKTFTTQRTFVLTWQPPTESAERVRSAISSGVDAQRRTENELLANFAELCERVESALGSILNAKRLGEVIETDRFGIERRRSDLLRFIASCVTGEDKPLNVPAPEAHLNGLLSTEVRGGFDVRVGGHEIGCVEIKSFPDEVVPRILEKLTELKVPHLFAVRVVAQSVAASRAQLRGAAVDYKGAATFNSGFIDPEATAASEQVIEAFGKASGDYTRVGTVSIVLVVRGRTRAQVAQAERAVIGVLEDAGFRGFVRKMGALDTWLSTLPANVKNGTRKFPLNSLTVAKVFPVHEASLGRRYAASEALPPRTPALTYALGRGSTLYRAHMNVGDVFHGFGLGKTRSGKSVMLAYLSASFRARLPLAGVTTIDKGRSSERICRMLDGQFYDLLGVNSPGFALFADAGDPEQDATLLDLLEEMVELQRGAPVTPEQHESLSTAVRMVASLPKQHRSLFSFYELLQDPDGSLRPAIAPYTRLGQLGTMFDATEDTFDVGRFNVIDIERVIGLKEKYLIPVLRVVTWKTQSQIRRMKERLGTRDLHWLLNIDEAHAIMRHDIGARFIADTQKMGRKENIGVWLWSNSLSDFAHAKYRDDLLLNTPSRIYFGDSAATESDVDTIALYKALQLPGRGIAMIPNLPERSFILHQPDEGVLVELNLRLDRDMLATIGTSRGNENVHRFRSEFPTERYGAHRWKLELLRYEGAARAAERLESILSSQAESGANEVPALLVATR